MHTETAHPPSSMRRQDLSFPSNSEQCAAWLYPARGTAGKTPIVVMAHGLSGTRRDGLGPFAERFAEAGIAALVFDHRGFGDSEGEPDLFHPRRQLKDWAAAITFARSLPGVDPDRVATFGSSMGGGNALAAAAVDERIAAAVSQVPFLDMLTQAHRASPVTGLRMLAAAVEAVTCARSGSRTSRHSSTHRAVRRAGCTSSRSARTAAGVTASPRAGCSVVPTVRSVTLAGCTARGSSASERPIGWRGRDRRSGPRGGPGTASCAPTPAWITLISTTALSTSSSWRTRSSSCGGPSAVTSIVV